MIRSDAWHLHGSPCLEAPEPLAPSVDNYKRLVPFGTYIRSNYSAALNLHP